ncbi:hypothetical protein PHYBLDRAFT_152374 [Phycomyces blakesleeanus NRRL 1555(-)]|uniref:Uncharacterized protein n=1 Tax=Phycomyces blakesleeanus (strain ATCC 8743b / DSM 1359 / FGSC 10004 / NBRC 33097 / NRRL 1555) TaxID=763407 RepID=A0A162WEJ9_PHYB8|nr:hypothetical protein PHYBLDRAFT_152374 [Phycomyces blakesleeanus NRRL 1555(-)]OAD66575.1 hypothetical protein PHYBLDRAFT_152374 [Phycomyces blakesleeanus NRRL 1555(-)]|eukprot:XP_018284615.1 hypothetical protein PHYBLDRAFT_152374 [Phycomyces blakesleeanus NRRL 1555(-)]
MNLEQNNPSASSQSTEKSRKKGKKYGHNFSARDLALVEELFYGHSFDKKLEKNASFGRKLRKKENGEKNTSSNNDLYPELERQLATLENDLKEEDEDKKKVKNKEVAEKEKGDELLKDHATESFELLCQNASSSPKKRRIEEDGEGINGSTSPKKAQKYIDDSNTYYFLKDFKDEIKNVMDTDADYEMVKTV